MTADTGPASRVLSIGLLWHSVNSGNLGVGALTIGNIALIRRAAAAAGMTPRFVILGFHDPGDEHYVTGADIESVPLDTKALLPGGSYWQTLKTLDCVLDIGGGDSFADIYSMKRFIFIWLSKMMASAQRVPLAFSPQTIGPFDRQPQTFLAAMAMKRAAFVVARDPLSFDVARRMAPKTPTMLAVDVAFALPFTQRTKADSAVIEVGVNISGLLVDPGRTGATDFGMQVHYLDYTRRLMAGLSIRWPPNSPAPCAFRASRPRRRRSPIFPASISLSVAECTPVSPPIRAASPSYRWPIAASSLACSKACCTIRTWCP
jgi:hypothetical protein